MNPRDAKPSNSGAARSTRRRVHLWDRLAESIISVGGVGVIVAVLGICVYLVAQVLPLFEGGEATAAERVRVGVAASPVKVLVTDEYQTSAMTMHADGTATVFGVRTGEVIAAAPLVEPGRVVTAMARDESSSLTAFGFADGSVQIGSVAFASELVLVARAPAELKDLQIDGVRVLKADASRPWGAVAERIDAEQIRVVTLSVDLRPPLAIDWGAGEIVSMDYRRSTSTEYLAILRKDGSAGIDTVRTIRPLGGGKPRVSLAHSSITLSPPEGAGLPAHVFATGDGDAVFALWKSGECQRYSPRGSVDTRAASPDGSWTLAERMRITEDGASVTTAAMLLGGLTLLVGDDRGTVTTMFAANDPAASTPDGVRMVVSHRIRASGGAIRCIGIGSRDRTIALGDDAGRVSLRNITSEKEVIAPIGGFDGAVAAVAMAPKIDGFLAIDGSGNYRRWTLKPGHPEASFKSLFGKVRYEGSPEAQYVYQSSSGEDTSEVKYSLVPLILGSTKATVFTMLFAVPLAVLGAIYTSEFMSRRVRRVVKPTLEIMASLPSVVLGFIAAVIVAPWVRDSLSDVLAGFFVVPASMLLGAYLWQLLPIQMQRKVTLDQKLILMLMTLLAATWLSSKAGPILESRFRPGDEELLVFGGAYKPIPENERPEWVGGRATMNPDVERRLRAVGLYFRDGAVVRAAPPADPEEYRRAMDAGRASPLAEPSIRNWLDGTIGSPAAGWFLLMVPTAALIVAVVSSKFVNRRFNDFVAGMPRLRVALFGLAKFVASAAAVLILAEVLARAMTASGLDARDLLLGPFSQRNTLVVSILIGFAVIPLIYTISEDAMSSVPNALRSASLGCGATPWQTAVRVVLPVAGSGIFSAIMIGLGRAVGETMIVVMATGNTPAMDWNIFSGFRTLSANIAVELPEAAQGSAHYRILFLCGLVLFAMTFVVNTTAEVVRQRFRKRAASM